MKRRYIGFATFFLAAAATALWVCWPSREPSYQGKRLTQWLDDLDGSSLRQENLAKDAIRQMGEKAMPWVIDCLRRGNSRVRQWAAREFDAPSVSVYEKKGLRAVEALGPAAKQAIPEVERALLDGDAATSAVVRIAPSYFRRPSN